jgi:hypothetical protein
VAWLATTVASSFELGKWHGNFWFIFVFIILWVLVRLFSILSRSEGLWLIIVKFVIAQHIFGINNCLWVFIIV